VQEKLITATKNTEHEQITSSETLFAQVSAFKFGQVLKRLNVMNCKIHGVICQAFASTVIQNRNPQ
jgi:hypothetical protein